MNSFTLTHMENKAKKSDLPNGLTKEDAVKNLAQKYIERAYKNLELMKIISELSTNKEAQKSLNLSETYSNDEWIIITSYYAMYTASLALLAKIGYKSDVHTSTIWAIEKFFVEKKIIGPEYLAFLNNAKDQVSKHDLDALSQGKENRETAQYNVTNNITHLIAEASMKNAYAFVNKARSIIES